MPFLNRTAGTVPTAAIREAFDYKHGCFTDLNHQGVVHKWLKQNSKNLLVSYENHHNEYRLKYREQGDSYDRNTYFWPEDATEDRWLNAL